MVVAVSETDEPVLYDPIARCFDPGLLRLAMLRRRLTQLSFVAATGLARSTVQQALSGERIADASAVAIFQVLERIAPMEIR